MSSQRSERGLSGSMMHSVRRSRSLRAALLGRRGGGHGGVAAVEGGCIREDAVCRSRRPRRSAAPSAITPQPAAGPASFADIVDRVKPAVVSVKVKLSNVDALRRRGYRRACPEFPPNSPFYHFFRHFGLPGHGEGDDTPRRHSTMAQGSGFFISADGYIVTNNHVVDHATRGDDHDGRRQDHAGEGDRRRQQDGPRASEGARERFSVRDLRARRPPASGDWVIAVGNPFGLGGTVTAGIVSARGRDIGSGPYDDFLQIDAPVNHGNSGGPTFNGRGRGRRRQHRDLLAVRRQRRHRLRHRERRGQERRPAAQGQRRRDARLDRRSRSSR